MDDLAKKQAKCLHWLKPLRRHPTYRYVCVKCDKKLKIASGYVDRKQGGERMREYPSDVSRASLPTASYVRDVLGCISIGAFQISYNTRKGERLPWRVCRRNDGEILDEFESYAAALKDFRRRRRVDDFKPAD